MKFISYLIVILLISCSNKDSFIQKEAYSKFLGDDQYHITYKGYYKIGKQYRIKNKTYKPKLYSNWQQTGYASWYGDKENGNKTANGDIFNKKLLTAAHTTLPMPSIVKVTNLENNRSIILMVNDRGPYAKNRIIDVSEKAAMILGFHKQGISKVHVKYLPNATNTFLKKTGITQETKNKQKHVTHKICSANDYIKLLNLKYKTNSKLD
ncbi:septal ring lytic transglycosylase RlpA family protein [Rickettsia endosymbiont of Cardiosporidium cionae]|uniref:septal ring lytic transglycosylase RlpA family protein n=1 Tax=Rickettsia endosymbiont of Cardiosporidium cionae TaxID=2777155 RepID=UPI001894176F|nr:septal ring lytic transglycosylase RlpA family protein [Rickettsia endosymbiont of Cardiosporidium cionae]